MCEIKRHIVWLISGFSVVNLPFVALSEPQFSVATCFEQVQNRDTSISLDKVFHVKLECFLCHLNRPCYVRLFLDAKLFPENRYGSRHLDKRNLFAPHSEYLLLFHEISAVSFVINTSVHEPRPGTFAGPSREHRDRDLKVTYLSCDLPNVALNHWGEPFAIYLLLNEISVQVDVPTVA